MPEAYGEIAFFKFNLSQAHPKKERRKGKRQRRSRADSLRTQTNRVPDNAILTKTQETSTRLKRPRAHSIIIFWRYELFFIQFSAK
ncbi:MAG: hypothetical protein II561_02885 [Thermoguttaceae bacterium]|nr:hypothetical protein [Thermoguttaceae bacterium]MBQ2555476.1 hypothetical protein [Thermoguttaceae bacterium]MBQ4204334.1 hypothetical protein [Thermoguttaceae bacterium]